MKQLLSHLRMHGSSLLILVGVTLLFFYKSIFFHQIPFGGDMLVSNYEPYKTYSYDGYAPGGVPNKSLGRDVIQEMYPKRSFTISTYKMGQIPLWNPYNFSGNPLMANFQSGVFYPINLVYFLFPFTTAWTIFVILAPLMASLFTYYYFQGVKVGKVGSIVGAIAFSYTAYMVVWLEYGNITETFLWLPLTLLFIEKLLKRFSVGAAWGLVLSLVFSFLAGYIQGYFYVLGIVVLYYLIRSMQEKKSPKYILVGTIACIALPILLGLYQLLPTLELFHYSSRGAYTFEQYKSLLNPLYYFITTLAPDFFGNPASKNVWFYGTYIERVSYFGILPFVFAVFAMLHHKKRQEIIIFMVISFIALLYATDFFVSRYFKFIPIPVISTTVPTRALSIFAMSGSILAGFGIDIFLKEKRLKRFGIAMGIAALILLFGWIGVFVAQKIELFPKISQYVSIAKHNLLVPTGLLIATGVIGVFMKRFARMQQIAIFGLLLLLVGDLFFFFQKNTPFAPASYAFPRTPVTDYLRSHQGLYRSWGYGSAFMESNLQTGERIYSPEGIDALHDKIYGQLIATSKNGIVPSEISRSDVNVASGYDSSEFLTNYVRQTALNILGVKYVMYKNDGLGKDMTADTSTFNPAIYKLVWQQAPWQVYENLQVVPRILITDRYVVRTKESNAISTLYDTSFDEQHTLVFQAHPELQTNTSSLRAKVLHIEYTPNKVTITADSNKPAFLFLSDTYFPGWHASVNSVSTPILRADVAYRAVPIGKGKQAVVFTYQPDSFKYGVIVSSCIFAMMIGGTFLLRKRYV